MLQGEQGASHFHLQEGLRNSSIEQCTNSSSSSSDPVTSYTNVTACLREAKRQIKVTPLILCLFLLNKLAP